MLHQWAWSETSLILDLFTREHGRIAVVAKGAKRPYSQLQPVLMPFQRLLVLTTRPKSDEGADILTLRSAEYAGGGATLPPALLFLGFYLNELLLKLLARDDPHPRLFDVYASVVQVIACGHGEALQSALRAFELLLLREIGLLPLLDAQTMTLRALDPESRYSLVPEGGLRQTNDADRASLSGSQWVALQQSLNNSAPFTTTLRACSEVMAELKPQLRTLLNYHCGVTTLRTRQMMIDLQTL